MILRRPRSVYIVALAASTAVSSVVLAAPPNGAPRPFHESPASRPVYLVVDPCVRADPGDIRRILAIELGAAVLPTIEEDRDGTVVTARCGASSIDIAVLDLKTNQSLSRSVSIAEGASTSTARLLALVMAELVFVSWNELTLMTPLPERPRNPPPTSTSETTDSLPIEAKPKTPQPSPVHPRERIPVRLVGVASLRKVLSQGDTMWGGGLIVAQDQFTWMGWSVDALYEHGSTGFRLPTRSLDLRVFTLGAALLMHKSVGPITGRAGVGLRAGMVQMQARGVDGLTGFGAENDTQAVSPTQTEYVTWGWPLLQSSLTIHLPRPLVAEIKGELGYVILPVRGMSAGRLDLNLPGWWGSMQLGFGVAL